MKQLLCWVVTFVWSHSCVTGESGLIKEAKVEHVGDCLIAPPPASLSSRWPSLLVGFELPSNFNKTWNYYCLTSHLPTYLSTSICFHRVTRAFLLTSQSLCSTLLPCAFLCFLVTQTRLFAPTDIGVLIHHPPASPVHPHHYLPHITPYISITTTLPYIFSLKLHCEHTAYSRQDS